jgi:hypothetical protein
MHSEPNWLNIEDELYPEVYISKVFRIENWSAGPIHFPVKVVYNSLHREINVTEALGELISTCTLECDLDFQMEAEYEVMMVDENEQKYKSVGRYPFKEPVLLGGSFVQSEFLIVKLIESAELPKPKPKPEKTIKSILQKVAQWRKIYL